MMLPILISVLLAPGSYFPCMAGTGIGGGCAPLLRSATTTPKCGAESPAAIKVSPAPVSYFVCTAPGVAATLSMANTSVGMIFMRASPKNLLLPRLPDRCLTAAGWLGLPVAEGAAALQANRIARRARTTGAPLLRPPQDP